MPRRAIVFRFVNVRGWQADGRNGQCQKTERWPSCACQTCNLDGDGKNFGCEADLIGQGATARLEQMPVSRQGRGSGTLTLRASPWVGRSVPCVRLTFGGSAPPEQQFLRPLVACSDDAARQLPACRLPSAFSRRQLPGIFVVADPPCPRVFAQLREVGRPAAMLRTYANSSLTS